MYRNFSVWILIFCFSFSSVNAVLASQIVDISPIVVQPDDLQEINQKMLEQDRINRDQELAIRGLIDDNLKLTDMAMARQQDADLEKINQTLVNYRDSLLSRDRARIVTNSQRASKYYDLITLTEDVDDMKDVGKTLQLKSEVIGEKYKILTELRNEMRALNEKLKGETVHENINKASSQQEDKIQMLTRRLGEMDQKIARFDDIIAQKDQQIVQLKETIKGQENQIANLQRQSQSLSSKEKLIQSQADQVANASEQLKNKNDMYAGIQAQAVALKKKMQQQDLDLKTKDESIRWLNQVVAVAKNKAKYYQLTSQQVELTEQQVQAEVQKIKDDFAQRFKKYDQFESAIVILKNQVNQLGQQLTQKQQQVGLLKSELENKITQENTQGELLQDLKSQLQDKDNQIVKMKAFVQAIQQLQTNDDRLKLARQFIDLQQKEASLLEEKNNLRVAQNALFDQHIRDLDIKIKGLLANRQIQAADAQSRMDELKNELDQKVQQVDLLKTELENKITEEKNQSVLALQVDDLKAQLRDKEGQIATLKADIQSGQETQTQADAVKQQLVDQQNQVLILKQELESKIVDSNNMTLMMSDYQKKLESKDNAYNEELKQVLSSKNDQAQMEGQIADLSARLQEKEAQVIKIKKSMYDLQESMSAKDRDLQSTDLNLSMIQQKMLDDKIKEYQQKISGFQATNGKQEQEVRDLKAELALARQQLHGMPSSEEIDFLRTGFKKATMQLKQKDDMLSQIKANADEYARKYKEQSQEFQSLKEQLQDAYDEISRKNEDLKYKDLEVVRLKERSAVKMGDLQDQIKALSSKMGVSDKGSVGKTQVNRVEALQAQLKKADLQVKNLQARLNRYTSQSKSDPLEEKLKQALDKIDEQGRIINILVQKLQDAGQSVNLTRL